MAEAARRLHLFPRRRRQRRQGLLMAQSRDEIETKIESMAQELADLRRRVFDLESVRGPNGLAISRIGRKERPTFSSLTEWRPAEIVGLAGRSLVVLGGAFLLRSISAAALLPDLSGPVLGLLYAAWWLGQSDRIGARGDSGSAFFHGLTGLAIANPLIWEATTRFHLLPGYVAAPAVALFFGAGLLVAARRDLRVLSWISVGVALVTTLALLFGTRDFVLYTGVLLAVAAAVESSGLRVRWPELRWAPAAVLDVMLVLLAVLVSQPHMTSEQVARLHPQGIVVVALLAPVLYLLRVASSTLRHRRGIDVFELGQVAASLLFGIGAAMTTISCLGGDSTAIALAITAVGAACYAVAFLSIDANEHPRQNFYAYTSFAGVLVGTGTFLLLGIQSLAATWLTLALAGTLLGVHFGRNTLRVHGGLYLTAAAMASGLAMFTLHSLFGPLANLTASPPPLGGLVLAGSVVCYAALVSRSFDEDGHWTGNLPRLLAAAVAVPALAGLAAPWCTAALAAMVNGIDQTAFLATIRTCVLSLLAAGLAWAGRRWSLDDLLWLVYPLMLANGARLLWEDLPNGAPVNLFLTLGFYGGALIVASRMHRPED